MPGLAEMSRQNARQVSELNLDKLRLVTIVAPVTFLAIAGMVSMIWLRFWLANTATLLLLVFGVLIIATVPFAVWVFGVFQRQQDQLEDAARLLEDRVSDLARANDQIERRHRQLEAANQAITAISSPLDPAEVLQRIVDSGRELVGASYGALGVADGKGRIIQFMTTGISSIEREVIGPLPEGNGLLGALIHEAKPIRLANIQADPRSSGFPANHPPMTNLLGVPILLHDEPVGDLYMTDKRGASEFSEEDQDLLLLLANHAAVAITNAKLYEEARLGRDRLSEWNKELEQKVAERSREIARQSRELTKRVLQAQEEERKRIARELHDETAQSLSLLLINIDLLAMQVPDSSDAVQTGFERLRTIAKRTLDETRALSHDLRPAILDDVGLVAAIRWFAAEWEQSFDLPVHVETESEADRRLPPETELALFRIAQEALTNAGKYSRASNITVSLAFPNGSARLVVSDDGAGFDVSATGPSRHGGLGLYGMRERAELIGARLEVQSAPNRGTRITVIAPIEIDESNDAERGLTSSLAEGIAG